mgnify:CR=1 FL=1
MPRKVSYGARSVCFLLPQYRGRYVSQMRNTHGISKALQYLKTHRGWLASQHSAKSFRPLRWVSCPKGRYQRLDWTAIAFCWRGARRKSRGVAVQNGQLGIARLADVCCASAVFVDRTGFHFWTERSKTAGKKPNLKTPIWSISEKYPTLPSWTMPMPGKGTRCDCERRSRFKGGRRQWTLNIYASTCGLRLRGA